MTARVSPPRHFTILGGASTAVSLLIALGGSDEPRPPPVVLPRPEPLPEHYAYLGDDPRVPMLLAPKCDPFGRTEDDRRRDRERWEAAEEKRARKAAKRLAART
jgi:hypothetical protein